MAAIVKKIHMTS